MPYTVFQVKSMPYPCDVFTMVTPKCRFLLLSAVPEDSGFVRQLEPGAERKHLSAINYFIVSVLMFVLLLLLLLYFTYVCFYCCFIWIIWILSGLAILIY